MFKIIKTSTYHALNDEIKLLKKHIELLNSLADVQHEMYTEKCLELHTLTAKKLPIKKSKNK